MRLYSAATWAPTDPVASSRISARKERTLLILSLHLQRMVGLTAAHGQSSLTLPPTMQTSTCSVRSGIIHTNTYYLSWFLGPNYTLDHRYLYIFWIFFFILWNGKISFLAKKNLKENLPKIFENLLYENQSWAESKCILSDFIELSDFFLIFYYNNTVQKKFRKFQISFFQSNWKIYQKYLFK